MATTLTCPKCGDLYASSEHHMCPDNTASRRPKRRNGAASIAPHPEIVMLERAEEALELWPTLDSAFGCANCKAIFRALDTHALVSDGPGRCPRCQSESCFDVAALINRRCVSVERLQPIVEMLDAELAMASGGEQA